ncbi:MAG TPA: glycoside hydrolase family 28 protein [Acidobacteriota bacterium]|nr:glycoside hydrolase family 28 protein [Acidobacteriota bacterium]
MQPAGLSVYSLFFRRATARGARRCAVAVLCAASAIVSLAAYDPTEPIAPIRTPFPMPQLQRPVFPARAVSIVEHGAVAGGETKNTAAFARAIEALAQAGGGRVVVPAGRWLTGPIHLRSNIELHLAEGAVVVFSDVFEDYLPPVLVRVGGIECFNYSPLIYARGCENVAITGPGRLDGNAAAWWSWKKKESRVLFEAGAKGVPVEQRVYGTREAAIRPSFVSFVDCRNVLLEGFTIGGGPNWTLHPVYCENVIVRRVNVDTDGPNNDGLDPDSCRNVLIEHCTFSTGDDCVVLKSGYNEDGWRVARPTENVVMRYCTSRRGHGGIVIGSEMSGDVRNVYMHDCDFEGTDRVLRIKSRPGRGGVVENVWVENVTARDLKYEVVILNMDYSADTSAIVNPAPPTFRNITVRKVAASGAPVAVRITGLPASPIQNVTFEDCAFVARRGVLATHARELTFRRCAIAPAQGERFVLEHTTGLTVDGQPFPAAARQP